VSRKRFLSRRDVSPVVIALALFALPLCGVGKGQCGPERKQRTDPPDFSARTFNSAMALSVKVQETFDFVPRLVGRTPSEAPLEIFV
jgi:hypothetical protein